MIYYILAASVIMCIVGFILGRISVKKQPVGTLHIDTSDPVDGPHLFLELEINPRNIMGEKQVTLNVNTGSYVSHE